MIKKEVRIKLLELEEFWVHLFRRIPFYKSTSDYKRIKDAEWESFNKYMFMKKLIKELDK